MTTELWNIRESGAAIQQGSQMIMTAEKCLRIMKVTIKAFLCFLIMDFIFCAMAEATNRSPIVLDMDGNGRLSAAHDGQWRPHSGQFDSTCAVLFDIDADGQKELTEWIGPEDSLLCAAGNDGRVESGLQLFGTAGGYRDGYEKLAQRDDDRSGALEGRELDGLSLWQDRNSNGICEIGELKPVSELGITKISTTHREYQSTFTINGGERKTWDWWPTVKEMQ